MEQKKKAEPISYSIVKNRTLIGMLYCRMSCILSYNKVYYTVSKVKAGMMFSEF